MSIEQEFKEKVSKLIFLEFKSESVYKIFKVKSSENKYFPLRAERVIDKVKNREKFKDIPLSFFVEGMFYVLGGDKAFKFNNLYTKILNENLEEFTKYIKGIILDEVKNEKYEDAYIMLKGLMTVEKTKENFDKLIALSETIRDKKAEFKEEELSIIDEAKKIENYASPYLYEAFIKNENKDYEGAWYSINTYIEYGGKVDEKISKFKHSVEDVRNYEKAKEIIYEKPKDALKMFVKLIDEFQDDAILFYYIGMTYRILGNYEKAIYYLNEALALDNNIVEIFNELGVNYAALNDFDKAISYLRKAFEATKSIEICTNLVMCYLNKGDKEQARLHYEIAKKMKPDDDVVKELSAMFD
ncbi:MULTISPECIES: tetratricopeptide repeat protein [Clostridium]|uniref:tetratricopeptide repeat protein n=1 Tax=Clostridium TaxID=1485 RepID=UPI00069EC776|nr:MULTISPECIES: tetratricopeptide repeat protein [Clostridium]KOF55967.1 capsular biosynthesis protein [Clostridium sp. DMHC 10]MCD2345372.1 tetratricopeptide repeat protein [Clostridium guangxiense]